MTRFARAKGSKASNERAPEESTPWAVMKEQLVRAKDDAENARMREKAEKQRLENYEKFLIEHKTTKRKNTWCDFPEENKKPKLPLNTPASPPLQPTSTQPESTVSKKKKKIKSGNSQSEKTSQSESPESTIIENEVIKKKKKKKKEKQHLDNVSHEDSQSTEVAPNGQVTMEACVIQDKLIKKKLKRKKNKNNSSNDDKPLITDENNTATLVNVASCTSAQAIETKPPLINQKKTKKIKAVRRKAEGDGSFQIIINGREVELVRYDGFPVMRRDAERLEELRQSMASKGIPKSELQRTMKLERRRAEKALARLKRDVCYNCRKGGHNLSDCPELRERLSEPGAASGADGVCFKCGSTEHRQFECKVQRGSDFRFASCFICKEQGHIARQCPDNPKGLYPNGGGCKLCGDVTHLRKDCPTTRSERQETSVRLDTLAGGGDVESVAHASPATAPVLISAAPKRIKF